MAGNRDSLEGQLTHVIQQHMSQPGSEASISVHQVQSPSGSVTKRHQIIIDIKQDIDINELSTRSLAESVMEQLGARSAAVYIDNQHVNNENNDLESLTTVNVIVANDLAQPASPQAEPEERNQESQEQAESSGVLPGNRIAVDRIVELSNVSTPENTPKTTTSTVPISTACTTASGNFVQYFTIKTYFVLTHFTKH